MCRQHAAANSRCFLGLVPPRYRNILAGYLHFSHSCSVIAIASLSLARTEFAATNRTPPACPNFPDSGTDVASFFLIQQIIAREKRLRPNRGGASCAYIAWRSVRRLWPW